MVKELIGKFITKYAKKQIDKLTNTVTEEPNKKTEDPMMNYIYDPTSTPSNEMFLNAVDYNSIPEPEIINPGGKKTLILVDDVVYTDIMYRQDAKKMATQYNVDPYSDIKMVKCLGEKAGFQAYKYAVIDGNPVDFGVLDITLGHQLRVMDSYYMEVDGIDVARFIKEKNPNFKFLLCTAHTLNKTNSIITKYDSKVEKHLGGKLEDYYLNKNSYRVDKFYLLVYGDKQHNTQE